MENSVQTESRWWNERRCLSCEHWCGDRDEEWNRIREWINEDLDLDKLCAIEDGPCGEGLGGINVQIHGDAWTDVTVDADFGCVEWEANDGQ